MHFAIQAQSKVCNQNNLVLFLCVILNAPATANVEVFSSTTIDNSYVFSAQSEKNILRGKLDVGMELKTPQLSEGSSLTAIYSILEGRNGSEIVGDIQGFSNIDADNYNDWLEIYISTPINHKSLFKIGYMDATSDFLAPKYGAGFINASMGYSPTVLGISTYPAPTLGFYYESELSQHLKLALGHYSGESHRSKFEDFFSIVELKYEYISESYFRFGAWHKSGLKSDPENNAASDIYVVVDHKLFENLYGFIQYGSVDENASDVRKHFSFGLSTMDLFNRNDELGIMLSRVDISNADTETAYEIFYTYSLNNHFILKPSWVYINNPSGNGTPNATILNIRIIYEL